jgi:DNA polymerase-4
MMVIAPGEELAFLDPLPVTKLWGVGPATLKTLDRMAIRTIGDVARLDEQVLVGALGRAQGAHLFALAHNRDDRAVETERETKSVGAEETFDRDLHNATDCRRELLRLADRAASRVRSAGLVARTITLKIRFADFETRTRAKTLPEATDLTATIAETAVALLDGFEFGRGVRLLGVSLSKFEPADAVQQALHLDGAASDPERERDTQRAAIDRATDAVRARFGADAVRAATLLGEERGR